MEFVYLQSIVKPDNSEHLYNLTTLTTVAI